MDTKKKVLGVANGIQYHKYLYRLHSLRKKMSSGRYRWTAQATPLY